MCLEGVALFSNLLIKSCIFTFGYKEEREQHQCKAFVISLLQLLLVAITHALRYEKNSFIMTSVGVKTNRNAEIDSRSCIYFITDTKNTKCVAFFCGSMAFYRSP